MREAAFIKANREKWQRIDEQTQDKDIQAEVLADNFIELTDDLSYARTFYPKSRTQKYLNQLAGRYFVDISTVDMFRLLATCSAGLSGLSWELIYQSR